MRQNMNEYFIKPEEKTEFTEVIRCLRLQLEILNNNERMYRVTDENAQADGIVRTIKRYEKAIQVLEVAGKALTEDPTWSPPQCERDKQARVERETKTQLDNAGYLDAGALGSFENGNFIPPTRIQSEGKLSMVADGMLTTVETITEIINAILKQLDTVGLVDGKSTISSPQNTQGELWKDVSATGNLTAKFRFVHNELGDILLRAMNILDIQKKLF